MTQLLEKQASTTPEAKRPTAVKTRIGRIVVAGALIGLLGGWGAFEIAANRADALRLEAIVASSQAMDRFYRAQVASQAQAEAERLGRLIARSQAMDDFYLVQVTGQAQTEAERLERLIARSQAMNEFYLGQTEDERLAGIIARSQALNDYYGVGE